MTVKIKVLFGLGFASAALVVTWLSLPRTLEQSIGPLVWVERPSRNLPYPHPAIQLDVTGVFVSSFVDLGSSTNLEADAGSTPLFFRTAHRSRSFRILNPPPESPVNWKPVPKGPFGVRRFVQFSSPVPQTEGGTTIQIRWKRRHPIWLWSLAAAVLLGAAWLERARLRQWFRQLTHWGRRHVAAITVVLLALISTGRMWNTGAAADEQFTVGMVGRVLNSGDYLLNNFAYPHLPVYVQVVGTVSYGILRSVDGICYHDPYSNQLYFDGRPVPGMPTVVFNPEGFPRRMHFESLPWIRLGYAVISALMIVLAYAISSQARSAFAGLIAAVAVAAQPLLMNAQILPNATAATVSLATALVMIRAPRTAGWLWVVGCLAGAAVGWKYNPAFGVVLVGFVLLETPVSKWFSRLAIAVSGFTVGFVAVHPSMLWRLTEFMTDVAREAHHYAWGGHPNFETDAPLQTILHGIFVRPQFPGNYLMLGLAVVGAVSLLAHWSKKEGWRISWVLLATPILATGFLWNQMVQFGRNYTVPLAFACVLSGIGGDRVLGFVDRERRGRHLLAALILILIGSVGVQHWWRERSFLSEPTARLKAIEWVDESAPLGSSVRLVEDLGHLEGVMPDRSRFRVRRGLSGQLNRHFDYAIVAEGKTLETTEEPLSIFQFTGRAVTGTKETYAVHVFPSPEGQ